MTIKRIVLSGLVMSLLLVTGIVHAASVYTNGGVTLNQAGPDFTSSTIDASGHESLVFSFDFNTVDLDGNAGDNMVYGWSAGGIDHDLGTINGVATEAPEETGSVSEPLPIEAQVADLTLYIRVNVDSPTSDDAVITNIVLSGDEVSTDVAMVGEVGYETLQAAVDAACAAGGTVEMVADVTTSAQVTIDCPLTLDGNGHTLFAPFAKTSNTNNAAIGIIDAEGNVTINDLTIDGTGSTGSRHGINTYVSGDIVLNDVAIFNNNAGGLNVNGSTVTATNLTTSGNVWGAVNVDPGSGVTLPSVFTLNSGELAESNQIWSDGANVTGTATVTVSAEGYDLYTLNGTDKQFWLNKAPVNAAYIGSVLYTSIQSAVDAALEGQTVNVGAGTYEGFSVSDKTNVTIAGAGKSSTIVSPSTLVSSGIAHRANSNMQVSVLVDNSNGVVIEGLTIESNDETPGSGGPDAIVFWNASTGSLENCAVTGTYTINGVQTGHGVVVDASGTQNASLTVENCHVSGFQKNGVSAVNGNGVVGGSTGAVTVTINDSILTGAGDTTAIAQNGLVVWNQGGGTVTGTVDGSTLTGFNYTPDGASAAGALAYGGGNLTTVSNSKFLNNELHLSVAAGSPSINAVNNWWGNSDGPALENLSEDVSFTPWYVSEEMNRLSNETPVITLLGDNPFVGTEYVEEGATATYSNGDDVSDLIVISGPGSDAPGVYQVRYNVTDEYGNIADEAVRSVEITSSKGGSIRRSGAASPQASIATAAAGVTLPSQAAPVFGEVLGAMTEAERQERIQEIRTQLVSLISQLIALLQAQVNAAQ